MADSTTGGDPLGQAETIAARIRQSYADFLSFNGFEPNEYSSGWLNATSSSMTIVEVQRAWFSWWKENYAGFDKLRKEVDARRRAEHPEQYFGYGYKVKTIGVETVITNPPKVVDPLVTPPLPKGGVAVSVKPPGGSGRLETRIAPRKGQQVKDPPGLSRNYRR